MSTLYSFVSSDIPGIVSYLSDLGNNNTLSTVGHGLLIKLFGTDTNVKVDGQHMVDYIMVRTSKCNPVRAESEDLLSMQTCWMQVYHEAYPVAVGSYSSCN